MSIVIRMLMVIAYASVSALAQAQEYPARIVRIVVPYPAGGGLDALARAIGQPFFKASGRPVLVDNKPGANGMIGVEYVAKSAPDGYTLLLTESAFVVNPSLYSKVPYDPFGDFAPITGLVIHGPVLVANPTSPVTSVRELIKLAKSKPGELTYASFGIGSSVHLIMEMLQAQAGIKLRHIPYKGAAPALVDVAAGHVDMMFTSFGAAQSLWKADKVRILAVSSANRSRQYPEVPTVAEAGLPEFEAASWLALFAPAGTPREFINAINAEVRKILSDPAFRAQNLAPQGFEPFLTSPERLLEYLKADALKWARVVREAKVKLE